MRRHKVMMILVAAVWCAALLTAAGVADAEPLRPAGGAVIPAGAWRKAIEVPGLGLLNAGGEAYVTSVSCGSAGNCVAGGSYVDGRGVRRAFVVSEQSGRWRKAIEVPGLPALAVGGNAAVFSVSCSSAGNCAAGG